MKLSKVLPLSAFIAVAMMSACAPQSRGPISRGQTLVAPAKAADETPAPPDQVTDILKQKRAAGNSKNQLSQADADVATLASILDVSVRNDDKGAIDQVILKTTNNDKEVVLKWVDGTFTNKDDTSAKFKYDAIVKVLDKTVSISLGDESTTGQIDVTISNQQANFGAVSFDAKSASILVNVKNGDKVTATPEQITLITSIQEKLSGNLSLKKLDSKTRSTPSKSFSRLTLSVNDVNLVSQKSDTANATMVAADILKDVKATSMSIDDKQVITIVADISKDNSVTFTLTNSDQAAADKAKADADQAAADKAAAAKAKAAPKPAAPPAKPADSVKGPPA